MKTTADRQAHLAESKALLDTVMNETNLANGGRGIDRLGELAGNLDKLSSEALSVANVRLGEFTEELSRSGMAEEEVATESDAYKEQLITHLRQVIRERL